METIAVYWEPKIKTYGIAERTGLSMVSFLLPDAAWVHEAVQRHRASSASGFLLAFARPAARGGLRFHFLLDGPPAWHLLEEFSRIREDAGPSGLRVVGEVELVYFQGPHFGDRYGIADAALGAMDAGSLPVLATVCTGASVYLVVPKKKAVEAKTALSDAFTVPER